MTLRTKEGERGGEKEVHSPAEQRVELALIRSPRICLLNSCHSSWLTAHAVGQFFSYPELNLLRHIFLGVPYVCLPCTIYGPHTWRLPSRALQMAHFWLDHADMTHRQEGRRKADDGRRTDGQPDSGSPAGSRFHVRNVLGMTLISDFPRAVGEGVPIPLEPAQNMRKWVRKCIILAREEIVASDATPE